MLFVVLLFLYHFKCYTAHPQCLDFRPPHSSITELKFCTSYSSYRCCSLSKDKDLEKDFEFAVQHSSAGIDKQCEEVLKQILCLECHPYAAHVFDAERPGNDNKTFDKRYVNFPGLCKPFCLDYFEKCRALFLHVARSNEFYTYMKNASKEDFCTWAEIQDLNYCYPDVEQIDKKKAVVSEEGDVILCVEHVAASFSNALFAVHANDGTHRMFVGEQSGLVYIVDKNEQRLSRPFLNITDRIVNSGVAWDERGLLGLVFHPNYSENGHFFVYYSAPDTKYNRSEYSNYDWYWKLHHKTRLSEFTVNENNPNVANHESELIIMEINQPEANHNGGMLLFGSDSYLYVFPGDGGGAGDEHWTIGNALNMSNLLGKVLRIDVNTDTKLYDIPSDNPFVNTKGVRAEIYAFGLRNPWRCSIDSFGEVGTERMFCGDVGQSGYEEIDVIEKGGNYGWRAYEGNECFDEDLCSQYTDLKFPILVYNHSIGQSIVGGYVYRGCDNPNIFGDYFYADTMQGKLFFAKERNGSWVAANVIMGNDSICNNGLSGYYHQNILSFGENERGELYILSSNFPNPNYQNSVMYRLVDPKLRGDPEQCNFNVRAPNILRHIKRRSIFYKIKNKKKKEKWPMKEDCVDLKKYVCSRYFSPFKGKKPVYECASALNYVKKNCRKTCRYC